MKQNATGFQRFLRRPDPSVYAILVYGSDAGLVSENIDLLKKVWLPKKDDPFAQTLYAGGQLAASGNSLDDEMSAFSMGGGDRLIHLKNPVAEEAKAITALVKALDKGGPKPVARLIVEAAALPASSALRKTFESSKTSALCLACYPDQIADISRLAAQVVSEAGYKIEPTALALLCASMPANRQILRQELEKLICYMSDQPGAEINMDHVRASVPDAGESSLDELVFSCTEGKSKVADLALQRALESGQAPVMIVRAIARHLFRLHEVMAAAKMGGSVPAAMARLRPPVFIMTRDRFTRQCMSLSLPKVEKALSSALETERALKSSSGFDKSTLGRFVLAVASLTH